MKQKTFFRLPDINTRPVELVLAALSDGSWAYQCDKYCVSSAISTENIVYAHQIADLAALDALISALKWILSDNSRKKILIKTNSMYVKCLLADKWIYKWKAENFEERPNAELLKILYELLYEYEVQIKLFFDELDI